jgi:hypothetical protein
MINHHPATIHQGLYIRSISWAINQPSSHHAPCRGGATAGDGRVVIGCVKGVSTTAQQRRGQLPWGAWRCDSRWASPFVQINAMIIVILLVHIQILNDVDSFKDSRFSMVSFLRWVVPWTNVLIKKENQFHLSFQVWGKSPASNWCHVHVRKYARQGL